MSPIEQALAPLARVIDPLLRRLSLDNASNEAGARQLMAEVLGTFGLVLFCAGSSHVDWWSGGQLGALGVGLVNGFGVSVMIFAFWAISGAHLNPAVSLGLWLTGKLPGRRLAPYVGAQLVGALIASSVMHGLFRNHTGEGESWLGANFSGRSADSGVRDGGCDYILSRLRDPDDGRAWTRCDGRRDRGRLVRRRSRDDGGRCLGRIDESGARLRPRRGRLGSGTIIGSTGSRPVWER